MPVARHGPGLTEAEARLLLEPNYAVAATLREDGSVQQTVVWIDWDGERVLLNTAEGRAKPRNLRRDPRIGLLVIDRKDPYRWLSVNGTAEIEETGADEHIDRLSQRYMGAHYVRRPGEKRLLIRVAPEHIIGYGID